MARVDVSHLAGARILRPPPASRQGIPLNAIRRIWGLVDEHIPAIHTDWWEDAIPSNFRAFAMMSANVPVPVTERRPLPSRLDCQPVRQLERAAGALLYAVFDPAFHYSLAGERLVYAAGVTILCAMVKSSADDAEIIAVPWSMGESWQAVVRRARQVQPPRLTMQENYIATRLLPRCQAAISVVSGGDIQHPGTNILASGGECPIAVCVGDKSIHFALDHRIYDAPLAGTLYKRFFSFLEEVGSLKRS